jgi:hypothetical protein
MVRVRFPETVAWSIQFAKPEEPADKGPVACAVKVVNHPPSNTRESSTID